MLMAIAETLWEMWIVGQGAKNSGQLWDSEDSLSLLWRCVSPTIQHLNLQTYWSGVQESPIAFFLDMKLYCILSLLTQAYKYC